MSVTGSLASARWRRLIPLAFVTYSFAYVDRSNYSLGAAGGLEHSLHITSGETGLLGGLFFIGYFIFQVPAASFAERRSVKKLMFWSLILWGIFAAAQGVIPWFSLLLVDRFLFGVVEAAAIPAMLVFLTHWFSDSERGRADTFLILDNLVTLLWMSIVSGYIIRHQLSLDVRHRRVAGHRLGLRLPGPSSLTDPPMPRGWSRPSVTPSRLAWSRNRRASPTWAATARSSSPPTWSSSPSSTPCGASASTGSSSGSPPSSRRVRLGGSARRVPLSRALCPRRRAHAGVLRF